jgi:hypothetical protein
MEHQINDHSIFTQGVIGQKLVVMLNGGSTKNVQKSPQSNYNIHRLNSFRA